LRPHAPWQDILLPPESLPLEKQKLEQEKPKTQIDPLNQAGDTVARTTTEDKGKELIENFKAILNSLEAAAHFDHDVFTEIILDKCKEWRDFAADWKNGQYVAYDDYNSVLLTIYEQAQTSVFATSDATYWSIWESPLGDRILEAHDRGKADVIRVFVFDDKNELTEEIMTIMKKQATKGHVKVRLWFFDENPVNFPPDIIRDFSIIDDGEAIGITEGVRGEEAQARWHFKDENKRGRFLRYKKLFIEGSRTLDQWENQRPSSST
jgi:hypothetical protein